MIGIGLAAWRANTPAMKTVTATYSRTLTPSGGLETPIVLDTALIWHPINRATLIYQPYDERPPVTYTWITGIPQRIAAIQAGDTDKFHLLWLTTTGALRRSQINAEGEQILAVVSVSNDKVTAFETAPLPNHESLLAWQVQESFARPIKTMTIDEWGRPLDEVIEISGDAERFAVATDDQGRVHWAWATNDSLYYQIDDTAPTQWPFEIGFSQWLEDLVLGIEGETVTLVWGVVDIETPQHTHYTGLRWQDPANPAPYDLPLDTDTPTRWLDHVQNDTYTLVAYQDGVWHPLLIEEEQVTILGDTPATAAAPRVWRLPDGNLNAAWGTIGDDGSIGLVMTSTLYTHEVLETRPSLWTGLLAGILQLPLIVGWLLIPALMIAAWPRDQFLWLVPSVMMVYWGAKLLWPSDMLDVPLMLETQHPFGVVMALLMLATLGGITASMGLGSPRARLLWFCVGDAVLTVVIFGVNRS